MRRIGFLTATIVGVLLGCGGSQAPAQTGPGDDVHATPASEDPGDGLDDAVGDETTDPLAVEGEVVDEALTEPPPVTFRLVNLADEDLVFSVEKGWQTVFIAFSGQPPNAEPIILYPKWCTSSCDLIDEERCPLCEEPETVKEVKAAEQRQVVAPGESFDLAWDGMVHVYEKTRATRDGRRVRCECYRQEPVPPETYTVRACGLRLTKVASESTELQCADATMIVPSEEPQVVTLEFPAK